MNLQLKQLRKRAGYKKQSDFARALGVKERTYASWEREEVGLSMSQACDIADFLGCSLDELAGRWEYVKEPKYLDPRQEALNAEFALLDDAYKDSAVAAVRGMAAACAQESSPSGLEDSQVGRSA